MKRSLKYALGLKLALSLVVFVGLAQVARADKILDLKSQLTISKSGSMQVVETIEYQFDGEQHGIFRDIPTLQQTASGKYYSFQVSQGGTLRDGRDEPYTVNDSDAATQLKIGDANKTISGKHVYQLSYTVTPVMRPDQAGDYFNWNVVGTAWKVPIEKASATISFPAGVAPLTGERCYTGASQSAASDCSIYTGGSEVRVSLLNSLPAQSSGLTVNVLAPAGSFDTYLAETDATNSGRSSGGSKAFNLITLLLRMAFAGILLFGLIMQVRRYFSDRKLKSHYTVIAQYEAPNNMTPPMMGLLSDNVADTKEITALAVGLAVNGYLKIERTAGTGILNRKDYQFTLLKPADSSLSIPETDFVLALFAGQTTVLLKTVDVKKIQAAIAKIKLYLTSELVRLGYIDSSQSIISSKNLTEDGAAEWAKVEGFKLFLSVTEKDRLAFHDAPEKSPSQFSHFLPAAIALGVDKQWAGQFANLDVSGQMSWYVDPAHAQFNSLLLVSELNSGFGKAMAATMTPQSSGSYSGGGFSGGGGGGGGGGSW